jgi:outer membrane protein OmpA-like peptidoglycan-associated protein
MKQTCWAFIMMLTLSGIASAQDRNNVPQLGVKGGVNFSSFRFGKSTPQGLQTSGLVRPVFGLFGNIPVARNFSVQVEGLYSGMGGFIKTGTTQGDIEQRLNYLTLPLMLKYHVMKEFKILGGVEFGTLLNSKLINEGLNTNVDNKAAMKNGQTSLTAGVEIWPFRRWVFGARYIHGLSEFTKPNNALNTLSIKNRAYQLTLGFVLAQKAPAVAALAPAIPAVAAKKSDKDNDGIADDEDKCPDVAGLAKYNGCPIPDTDGDGINDEEDKCPTVAGIAKYNGCPIPDTDKDGINDEEDQCPTVAGVDKYHGCPIPDTDGDGVNDEEDRCISIAGPADNNGCPKINFNAENVQFASGTANLTTGAKTELNKLVTILNKDYPDVRLSIEGHTDNTGKADANQLLSEKRAAAVKTYLVSKKVDVDRLDAVGYGQDQPIADNATPEGRAKNRRVAFKISE